jgi:hypothetical protein
MRRLLGAVLLAGIFAGIAFRSRAEGEAPRFAEVTLRLLTMGDKQSVREVGVFSSSLPLGKAGILHRSLSVVNETKGTRLALDLAISVTPSLDDGGFLHCVVLSEATPKGAEVFQRAKDVRFSHSGEQVMELFADSSTGTRLALAISAKAAEETPRDAQRTFPPITFVVRVEQWNGAQRAELENLQLQSLEGATVSHDYQRKVPRWVEDTDPASAPDKDTLSLDGLPLLDLNNPAPTVQAGQSFSIRLSPKEQDKQRRATEREEAKVRADPGVASASEPLEVGGDKPRKIFWDMEFYHLSMEPLALRGNELALRLSMRGQILDPVTKQPVPPVEVSMEKSLLPGQPTPFYLTREVSGGSQGYVVWVIPRWPVVPPPEAAPQPPASTGSPRATGKESP